MDQFLPHLAGMIVVMGMGVIHDAELILARVERPPDAKKQRLIGLDAYYITLLERAYLPDPAEIFPNRCLTRTLHRELTEIPGLRFTTLRSVGIYFAQKRFRDLGTVRWRTAWGYGWAFGRLANLREAWEIEMRGWHWPNQHQDWVWNR
jgi:hypothetical protein